MAHLASPILVGVGCRHVVAQALFPDLRRFLRLHKAAFVSRAVTRYWAQIRSQMMALGARLSPGLPASASSPVGQLSARSGPQCCLHAGKSPSDTSPPLWESLGAEMKGRN